MCFYVALMMEELESIKELTPVILSHMRDIVSLLKDACDSTLLSPAMHIDGIQAAVNKYKIVPLP